MRDLIRRLVRQPKRLIALLTAAIVGLYLYWNGARIIARVGRPIRIGLHSQTHIKEKAKSLTSSPTIFNLTTLPAQTNVSNELSLEDIFTLVDLLSTYPSVKEIVPEHPRKYRYTSISSLESNRTVLLALNLINSENTLPNFIYQLHPLLTYLGPNRVHVSIFENGSKDSTPVFLRLLASMLDHLGTSYTIIAKGSSMAHADLYKQNARIPVLAAVRNAALEPLFSHDLPVATLMPGGKFDTVLFMNDIIWKMEDVLEILLQEHEQKADMACSVDWESHIIWDRWVIRSISGRPFYLKSELSTYFHGWLRWLYRPIPKFLPTEPLIQERFESNLPTQVFSCWNGMVAMNAAVFLPPYNIRFRTAHNDDPSLGDKTDKESECFLIAVDMWKAGFKKILATKLSSVAYDVQEYNRVRQDADNTKPRFLKEELIDWIEEPPSEVAYHDWSKWGNERWGPWDEA